MITVDVVIIGAGIVGLSTAYQLKKLSPHLAIALLEKEESIAAHQTGRNSGVVHSGVYYKSGSLKAQNCALGRRELLAFCDAQGVRYQKVGKVIVATREEEIPRLEEIGRRGIANGVEDLQQIGPERLREIEPHVQGVQALLVPNCHIIRYTEVAQALAAELQKGGVEIHLKEEVKRASGDLLITSSRSLQARYIVNCAGLFSDRIARLLLGRDKVPHQILPFRGEYYELAADKHHLVRGLIYPVPDPKFPFLGVHLTRMIGGGVEAGPNAVLALAREGYSKSDVDLRDCLGYLGYSGFWKMALRYWNIGLYELYRSWSKRAFLRDVQRLVPEIEEADLIPGNVGIRAQVVKRDGRMLDDFLLLDEGNMIHVLNAPSPAATASFAIGRQIAEKVMRKM